MKNRPKNVPKITLFFFLIIIVSIFFAFLGCTSHQKSNSTSKSGFFWNTIITISIYDEEKNSQNEAIINDCFDLCKKYELIFSRTNSASELYRLNDVKSAEISDELLHVIETSLKYCRISDGCFDITTGIISDLYKFGTDEAALPSKESIKEALPHVDYNLISVNGNKISIDDSSSIIDLGAVAKGYIADRLKEYMISKGVESAIINLGGNVLCIGSKPDGTDFEIGIRRPFGEENDVLFNVAVNDLSVVSSGIYERSFTENDVLYHHILNPYTGYPYDNGIVAVSIVGPVSEICDVLSTTCFTMGIEKGLALIDDMEDYYGVFIGTDDELHFSKGFKDALIQQ